MTLYRSAEMLTPLTTTSMPLRQTCDRCRELKVRCRRDQITTVSGQYTSAACSRCVRAGSNCVYNPQQPSGRPRLARSRGKVSRQRAASQAASQPFTKQSSEKMNEDELQCDLLGFEWPHTQHISGNTPELDELLSVTIEPGHHTPPTDPTPSSTYASVQNFSGSLNFTSQTDEIETGIQELTNLNLRIHRAMRSSSAPQQSPIPGCSLSSEDLIDMTKSLFSVMDRARDSVGPQSSSDISESSFPDSRTSSSTTRTSIAADTSTVLMALACYERLLDLFGHICSSCELELSPTPRNDHYVPEGWIGPGLQRPVVPPYGTKDNLSTNAQIVMTIELIKHLLDRLGRALRQLVDGFYTDSLAPMPLTVPTLMSTDLAPTTTHSISNGDEERVDSHTTFQAGNHPAYDITRVMLDAMQEKQKCLTTGIGNIKRIIGEKHGI
ncbi:hypothetical protein F4811DRAFT_7810 [Daldinia bambusicola]|nr:hypothetical protein F4811DRAFT_7810 [Daldinia bambusicola]